MLGLRERSIEEPATPVGCRVAHWLNKFDGDDRVYLIEKLESEISTDRFVLWVKRNALVPIGKDKLNDHRHGRCTCPANAEGRLQ